LSSPNYTEVAYFLKTFGLKGELKVAFGDNNKIDLQDQEVIFVREKGQHIPYFVEHYSDNDGTIIMKLEDINSLEQAKSLCKQKIYLDIKEVEASKSHNQDPNTLVGFKVHNEDQLIGVIDRLESFPQQVMAFVAVASGDEIMIPLNDEFIKDIDEDAAAIFLELPEGLLEL